MLLLFVLMFLEGFMEMFGLLLLLLLISDTTPGHLVLVSLTNLRHPVQLLSPVDGRYLLLVILLLVNTLLLCLHMLMLSVLCLLDLFR